MKDTVSLFDRRERCARQIGKRKTFKYTQKNSSSQKSCYGPTKYSHVCFLSTAEPGVTANRNTRENHLTRHLVETIIHSPWIVYCLLSSLLLSLLFSSVCCIWHGATHRVLWPSVDGANFLLNARAFQALTRCLTNRGNWQLNLTSLATQSWKGTGLSRLWT